MFDMLGLDPKQIQMRFGDTDALPFGRGTGGSRSANVGATAIKAAAEKIITKAKKVARICSKPRKPISNSPTVASA